MCVRALSDRQTASAATCVKQQSKLLFYLVSAAVIKPSLHNREHSIVGIRKKGQDSITSFKYKYAFCLKMALSIAIKKTQIFCSG